MRVTSLCLAFLVNLVLSSCSDNGEGVTAPVQNSTWLLQSIQAGGQTTGIPNNEVYTLHFENDTLVTGQVHCNTYWTDYRLASPDSVSFGAFNVTKVGCPLPPTRDEFRFAFDNANSLVVAGTQLRLSYLNRTRSLIFEREL